MRALTTLAVTLLAASGLAPGGREGPEAPPSPDASTPPARLDTRSVRLRLSDGKLTGSFEYSLVVGTFYEWNTDPTAIPGLMSELSRRTGVRATVVFTPIGLDEDRIRRNPLLILTGNRFFHLTDSEAENLRRYLRAGGFIYADDCGGADRSFRAMVKTLLPESELVDLDASHPIFRSFYKLPGTPKVLDLYGGPAKGYGAFLGDRLALFYTYDTDVPCGWEKNPDGSFVHLLTRDKHEAAYRMGVNVVMYVLRELHRRRVARPASPAEQPTARAVESGEFLPTPLRTYRMKPLMPCNLIRAIAPAARYVWFGGRRTLPGEQEGIAQYDYETDSWRMLLDSEGVLADEINCLVSDGQGLWIGTSTIRRRWNYGLWYYDPKAQRSRRYTEKDGLVDNDVYDLAVCGDELWVATRSGVARYDRKSQTWSKDPGRHRTYVDLTVCLAVGDRYVWFGRANGLRRYDRRTGKYTDFDRSNSPVRGMVDVLVRDGQTLWISCSIGLLTYRNGRFTARAETRNIAAASVLCGAADERLLCFGTRDGGLFVLDKESGKWRVFGKGAGLPCDWISRVSLDERSIWCAFGAAPLGVARYDRDSGKWSTYTYRAGIPCDHVYSLIADGGNVYVGTMANGLWRYEPRGDRWCNLNLAHRAEHAPVRRSDVYAMLRQGRGIWLGTNQGLCRCSLHADRYQAIPGGSAAIAALATDGGRVLCGTKQRGLMAYNPNGRAWNDLTEGYGLRRCPITALASTDRYLWVGTEEELVVIEKNTRKRLALSTQWKLVPVSAVLATGEQAWVGTTKGLLHCRLDEGIVRCARQAVLGDSAVTALKAWRGGLLVGTRDGVTFLPGGEPAAVTDKRLRGHVVSALAGDDEHLWIGTLGHGLIRAGGGPAR